MSDDKPRIITDPQELGFRSKSTQKEADVHDEMSQDNYNWIPADVVELPETTYEGQKSIDAWLERHAFVEAACEVLVGFGYTPAGHEWLVTHGWRFCDLQCDSIEMLTARHESLLDEVAQQLWRRSYKKANDAERVMLRDWRQDLKKCAIWVLAQDPLDILKIASFTEIDRGNHIGPLVAWGINTVWNLAQDVLAEDGGGDAARDDGMWIIEAYVLLSSVQNYEDLLSHKPIQDPRSAHTVEDAVAYKQYKKETT